jgi:hypothetical protein
MNREDIIRMAREAGFIINDDNPVTWSLERFAALVAAAERNKLAQWMVDLSYATGHGDTTEDLLDELDWQITESWSKVVMASVEAEREACAMECIKLAHGWARLGTWGENNEFHDCAAAIRARGQV